MGDTASRANPAGGAWRAAVVPVPAKLAHAALEESDATSSPEAPTRSPVAAAADGGRVQLEFFISNGTGQDDRPHPGGSYRCVSPGGFKLQQGRLQPFPRARQPPSMLVSDPVHSRRACKFLLLHRCHIVATLHDCTGEISSRKPMAQCSPTHYDCACDCVAKECK